MTATLESPAPPRRDRPWVRWVLAAVIAVFVMMWVYVLFLAPKGGVYRVRDEAWRTSARQICTDATARRRALADTSEGYISNPTPAQMVRHADLVDQATTILSGMLDSIDALPLSDPKDQVRVETFLKYYRVILDDRHRYTARLRALTLAPYDETLVLGGPVTNIVTDFTSGNDIKACVPPGELGGA